MPFFKEFIIKNKNKVTLQVQIHFIKYRILAKRVLSATSFKRRGSLTIEAAMVLPLFLFFMVLLMLPMQLMNKGRQVQTALEVTGEEVSQYAYVLEQRKQGKRLNTSKADEMSGELKGVLTEQGILLYVRKRVEARVDISRLQSVSFVHSSILKDGETIDLIMNYRMDLPFSVFGLENIPMTARSCRRAWIGKAGNEQKRNSQKDELVYVGKNSTRYHKDPKCHYLYNDIQKVSMNDIKNKRNRFGKKYQPCNVCGRFAGKNSMVFIMPGGEHYHSDKNCSSIKAYVKAVPLSEVEYLGPCSYCSQ